MVKEYIRCRLCAAGLEEILDFGETALANSYLKQADLQKPEFCAPLVVCKCRQCGCVQLKHTVSAEQLFKHYLYASSDSKALRTHFERYARTICEDRKLVAGDLCVDIGSNDGVLLEPFHKFGCRIVGIEPASNLCIIANAKGLTTVEAFFGPDLATDLVRQFGHASVITCNNCFAHIDNLQGIVDGVNILLKPDGVFVFENAYWLDSVNGKYFDQIYHEHIFYHSLRPLRLFLNKNGLAIINVDRNEIQGGTIRVFCAKLSEHTKQQVLDLEEQEEHAGIYEAAFYATFKNDLNDLRSALQEIIRIEKSKGKRFACYGAPAKATLLCKFFGLTNDLIDFVVDDAPMKQGLYMPETHIPIVSREQIETQKPDFIIIAAWNFSTFIMAKNPDFNGRWIVPMPTIQTYDNSRI